MTQLPPPSHIKPGDHIRVHEDPALGKPDWRVMGHKGLWEVSSFKTDQRHDDAQPTLYIKLKSVKREGGLAYITLPYSNKAIELVESQPEPKEPIFPEKGSQVVIREGGSKDGLWEIQQAKMEMLESGTEGLRLCLKSLERKNLTYINVHFNALSMKPVMPEGYDAHKPDVAVKRTTNVFKPISFKK
jgi:hypothetical protein